MRFRHTARIMKTEGNAGTAFENRVKRLLSSGRAAWGIGAVDESEYSAKLAINCDPDFLWIDLEHRPYGISEVRWIPILCRRGGVAPMVRVPNLDGGVIKKALDIGANTVMVPQVGTVDEAKRVVEYAKYPPQGSRGITPSWTTFMDVSWDDYLPAANAETCVVVQIESPDGIANLDAIAAVDGVDVVFAGPSDLAASLGVIGQLGHPKVRAFLADFPQRVSAASGKASGIALAGVAAAKQAYAQGYRFINIGSFGVLGTQGLTAALDDLRGSEQG